MLSLRKMRKKAVQGSEDANDAAVRWLRPLVNSSIKSK